MEQTQEFRRVHRLTPLLRFWTAILAVFAAFILNLNGQMFQDVARWIREGKVSILPVLLSLLAVVAFFGLIWLVSAIWWKAMGFRIGDEELAVRNGVISSNLRTARYDRIQAVDVVEPVIARIFGVAAVRVETAGSGDSAISIMYLKKGEAEEVRREVMSKVRNRGTIASSSSLVDGQPSTNEAHEDLTGITADQDSNAAIPPALAEDLEAAGMEIIAPIPVQNVLLASALKPSVVFSILPILIVALSPLGVVVALPYIIGVLPYVWNVIDRSWNFRAVLNGEHLNITYGLADKRRQTIPLHRIHSVRVSQPFLWKWKDWWCIDVSIAGYGQSNKNAKNSGSTMLLPVGTREQAWAMLELMSPLTEEDIATVANPLGATDPDFVSPPKAKWLSPIDVKQQSVTLVDHFPDSLGDLDPEFDAVVCHAGRFGRRMSVVHPSHIQELTLHRGPIGNMLGVANVRFDLVQGPVLMEGSQLLFDDAYRLLDTLRKRKLPAMYR